MGTFEHAVGEGPVGVRIALALIGAGATVSVIVWRRAVVRELRGIRRAMTTDDDDDEPGGDYG